MKLEPVEFYDDQDAGTWSLMQVLRPVRLLTKFVYFLPEWIEKPRAGKLSSTDLSLVILSVTALLSQASLLAYALYCLIVSFSRKEELMELIHPVLWILWNGIPFSTHVFILHNLKRLPQFFHLLADFTNASALSRQYPVAGRTTTVVWLYTTHTVIQLVSATGLVFYMFQYPLIPPLLTSIGVFRTGPWWYVATSFHMYSGIYASVGLATADLGFGFVFYYLGLHWRSLVAFLEDGALEFKAAPFSLRKVSRLWQTHEEIVALVGTAEALLGPLILANQLNQLGGATVFCYTAMRSAHSMTSTSVMLYISNSVLASFRAVVFNFLVSHVHREHLTFQQRLARRVAQQSATNLDCPHRWKQYSVLKDLLSHAQNIVVAVSPYKLYNVTCGTLCTMGATIVAYLVILLQSK